MALLSTNLKGRNVTLQRIVKESDAKDLSDLKTTVQNKSKEIKTTSKEKKTQDKAYKKQQKSAKQHLSDFATVSALTGFWGDTEHSLKFNPTFEKTQGITSEQQLLDALVTDSITVENGLDAPLMNLFIENPSATVGINTYQFFPSADAAREFKRTYLQKNVQTKMSKTQIDSKLQALQKEKNDAVGAENKISNQSPNNQFKPIVLVGVQKISVSNSSTIGSENGLITPFIQGWYNNPVKIEISGKSYMGAFEKVLEFFPETGDTTKQELQDLFLDNDTLFKQNQGLEVELAIQNEGVYNGLLTDYNFEEDISEPYILNYTISFTGFRNSEKSKANGEKRFKFDLSAALNIVPAQKGIGLLLSSVTPKLNG